MFYDIGDPNEFPGNVISEWLMFKQLGSFTLKYGHIFISYL